MKTNYSEIILSLAAIFLAISGAVASQKKNLSPVLCYITPIGSTIPCQLSFICTTTPSGSLCTIVYQGRNYIGLGKVNPSDTTCPLICYRPF